MAAIAHDHDNHRRPVAAQQAGARRLVLVPPDPVVGAPYERRRPGRRPVAVYRRRRLAALAVVAALLVITVAIAGSVASFVSSLELGANSGSASSANVADTAGAAIGPRRSTYLVQPGDTVWRVARRLQPSGDIRSLVDRIVARNGGPALRPGQSLVLE